MKHLGNCAPKEFLAQVGALREPYAEWIRAADARAAWEKHIGSLPPTATAEQQRAAHGAFLGAVASAAMERCPALTRTVLGLITFTPPEDFESRPMAEYLRAAMEIYGDRVLRDFFTYWPGPGRTTGSRP